MVKSYQDLKEKCLGMTAFFETSSSYPACYGVTASDFDGAGLSHGVLQYNFKSGTLQPLWNHMNNEHTDLCQSIFGSDYQEWSDHINADFTTQKAWGNSIGDVSKDLHKCIEPWNTYFLQLGTSEPSIAKQIELSQSYHDMTLIWFNRLGLYSRRGYALIFDIAVQMGRLQPQNLIWMDFQNIDPSGKTREQIELEKLRIIVKRVSFEENNVHDPWIQDIVFKRKSAVIDGFSDVGFNIDQYDLEFDPAFKGGIFSGY